MRHARGMGAGMTIKEIAALCGVSRGTVDRVLNHRGRVKPETERAVRAALEQAGYTKNIAGRALTVRRQAPRIGVVLCGLGNPFFDEVLRGIAQAEAELQDWGVRVELRLLRGYDSAAQRRAMEELKDCAALVIQPINAGEIREEIAALAERGVPVITINADLEDSRRAVYVGADYYRGGLTAGGMVNLCCPGGARLGVVAGARAILGHAQRLQGFLDALSPAHQVLERCQGEDEPERIYAEVSAMLKRRPELNALFVAAAGCASACQAVLDAGRAGQVQAFGFDLVPENAAMMRRGVIRALICQQPRRQGHDAIRAAWQLLLNEGAAQERILMETSICILQNMDEA